MKPNNTPPARALKLLAWGLPYRIQESIIGDLMEEQHAGNKSAAWFWVQAIAIVGHYQYEQIRESLRSGSHGNEGDGIMETLWNDIRFGARMLWKSPVFTIVSVLTLALGLGANTAIFSVVNALLIQPLPVPNSERLVSILGVSSDGGAQYISYPDFEDMTRQLRNLDGISAMVGQSVNFTGRGEPERVRGGFVSDNFFELIGVRPAVGRSFVPNQDDRLNAERVCILQHETWIRTFGADPKLLGQAIRLNNEPYVVIGILPQGFRFPLDEIEVWIPHHNWPPFQRALKDGSLQGRKTEMVAPIGLLKKGMNIKTAESELRAFFQELSTKHPDGGKRGAKMSTFRELIVGDVRVMVLVLLGAVVFVLLIACTNVANLTLSRAAARHRELATRAALGAGRARLMMQLFAETALLWIAGCAGGLLLGAWALKLLIASAPVDLPGGIVARLDFTVFAFSFGLTALTAIFFGLIPAFRFSTPNLTDALKEGGRTSGSHARTRMRAALVVGQVALTLILMIGSGLMLRSFQQLVHVNVGFQPDHLLTMEYRLPLNKYPEPAQQAQTHKNILEAIQKIPGLKSAALVSGLPFSGNGDSTTFDVVGQSASEPQQTQANMVTADFFRTMGIPILRGRGVTEQDREGSPLVVVINQFMADRYWPNQNPIGQRIRILSDGEPVAVEVVGVVGNTKQYGLDDPDVPFVFGAQAQQPGIFNTIAVRTTGDPMQMANTVRAAVWSVDPEQPVWKIRTQQSLIDRSLGLPRYLAQLMIAYASLALLLAIVGIYGVMSYNVAQRTYEIGVRMALGAQRNDVVHMVLRHGIVMTAIGVAVGLCGALALGRAVQSLLFGIKAYDPVTLVSVAGLLLVLALVASYIPARRATRVDPLQSLRYE